MFLFETNLDGSFSIGASGNLDIVMFRNAYYHREGLIKILDKGNYIDNRIEEMTEYIIPYIEKSEKAYITKQFNNKEFINKHKATIQKVVKEELKNIAKNKYSYLVNLPLKQNTSPWHMDIELIVGLSFDNTRDRPFLTFKVNGFVADTDTNETRIFNIKTTHFQ